MKLQPLHDWVLIRTGTRSEKSAGGIIIPETAQEKPEEGEVLAVGAGRFVEDKDSKEKIKKKTFVKTTLSRTGRPTAQRSRSTTMKMLQIVCGEKLEEEILALLQNLGIKGYTLIKGVGGSGQTGTVSGTGGSIDRNTLFMVALEADHIHMTQVLNAVKEIHAKHVRGYRGLEIPLKVFLQPCEVIL